MSNALRQNQRVNIREGNGNGNGNGNNGSNGGYDASLTYCVDLEPSSDEVMAELKSHVIMKVGDKLAIGKDLLKHKNIIFNKLVSLGQKNLANLFIGALPKDLKGARGKNGFLVTLFLRMRDELLCPILNNPNALADLSGHVVTQLSELKLAVDNARSAASTQRASTFATKFINLRGADADRKYLKMKGFPHMKLRAHVLDVAIVL